MHAWLDQSLLQQVHVAYSREIDDQEWGELFLDLTFVAVSLKEGRLLTDAVKSGQFARGLGLFVVTL
jgi:hypothetical protein